MLAVCEGRRSTVNIKHKFVLLLGIVIMITVIGISTIIAAIPSEHRKIVIKSARQKNLVQRVVAEGVIEPNKKQVIKLDSSQKVLEVLTSLGQEVKKGDLLLKLDSSDNQYRLAVEETNLKLAERELAKALSNESSDRKEAEFALTKAEGEYAYAKAELEAARIRQLADRQLFETGGLSKLQYDESLQQLQIKENELAEKAMELERAAKRLEDFDRDRDEKLYKLRSNIELINKNINSLKSKVDAETRADIDGRVVKIESEDAVEILIYDTSRYIVNIGLKQQEALYVKEGMKAKVKVKGLDEKQYTGTVVEVGQVALAEAGATGPKVEVKVNIDNPDEDIKTGYAAEVQIDLSMKTDAVVVDFEAIIEDVDGKKYIYYVEDDMARRRIISTGIETSFEVEITEGLIQGDRYVVNPPEDMQEKTSMRIWGWRYESK